MAKTVIVEYEGIYGNYSIATLVGPHPTITVTNLGITATISYTVIATVLSEEPLLSTITLPTKTTTLITGTTTFQLGTLTTIPAIQLPPQTTTSITSSSFTSELSPSSPRTSHTSASASATSTPSPDPQFTTGAITGAAVGCLIGGALIASLLIWLFMSYRRKKRRPRGDFVEHWPNSRNVNQEMTLQPELPA